MYKTPEPVFTELTKFNNQWDDEQRGRVKWQTLFSSGETPTRELSSGIAEMDPGDVFKTHRHKQAEIYYFIKGTGLVQIGENTQPVEAGTAVFIPGDSWHSISNNSGEPLRFFYTFAADSFGDIQYEFQ